METLTERHDSTKSLHALHASNDQKKKRASKLLGRKQGGGRKQLIDEDEKFLDKCTAEKATGRGRRHDAAWYLTHRVKGFHLLQLINQHHLKRNLPPIKSKPAVYNRRKPKNQKSIQAKNWLGVVLLQEIAQV